ncbi:PREDICTED: probable protein phosphatase 2C 25 [Fragaria vesca subsp. vesca]|uniref:probable protein phosphatase 2C 25 n=1 Tax=Fragaria vesca subsp. vesca TaxID=101020 RepID=UPI0002C32572|nr:PREDICTED: probable protein phosphatase 2C 25 [Fragaria vesca subsp. vesca]
MPCALVAPNSPIFSPSKIPSIFCRSSSSSPRLLHVPPPTPSSRSSNNPLSSPKAFQARFQSPRHVISNHTKEPSGLGSGPGLALKRKRPMRIDIPIAPVSFAVDSPKAEERVEAVEVDEDGYSVYCKRGKRGLMEDRYSAMVDSTQALFGVFDGHGGSKAAEFAAKNLDKNIADRLASGGEEKVMEAVKEGYLATDAEFLKEDVSGGACCVTALVQKGNLVVSNAGDCRAVMSRGGVAEALTSDHHPCRTDERARIESSGGYVDYCHGVWRIQGSLAVSRGIGDRQLKQWVIAEPETKVLKINPECEFLMLASDGLWDKVTNQEAVDIVRPLCVGIDNPELFSACKKLVDLSISRGSMDDTSVMIIQLGRFVS